MKPKVLTPSPAPSLIALFSPRRRRVCASLAGGWLLPLAAIAVPLMEFKTPPVFPVGDGPWQIVAADFNADGLMDMATANFDDSTVSVLLATGQGSFVASASLPVGSHPDSLAVGDLNGDGKPDIVTANGNGWNQPGTLSVLLGRGDGTFEMATHTAVDRGPRGVVVADFNGDGQLDAATAISGGWFETNRINVLFGRGDGTFEAPASYGVGIAPAWIASGDFNGDHRPDLVTANAGPGSSGTTASVLLNAGNGTFMTASNYAVGSYPGFVLVADLNQDTLPDLAVANRASGSVSVLAGAGDGTFLPASHFAIAAGVSQLATADFNGDTHPDLAVLGASYDAGAVTVLAGDGAGSFGTTNTVSIGASLLAIAADDFDKDGTMDLAVAGAYDNAVLLMAGRGDGTFRSTTDTCPVGGEIHGILAHDFDRDGQLDLATANVDADSVSVILQQTNGVFHEAVNYPVGAQPRAVKAGDFDNDGRADLVTANFDGSLTLLRGRASVPGAFTQDWPALTLGSNHTDVAVGHFNADTNLDIVTPNYYGASLSVALGNGDGTFQTLAPPAVAVNSGPTCVAVEDFDGDGQADLAVGYDSGCKISVLRGNGDGTFQPKTDIDTWEIPWFIAGGDFNFDGKPDLVAAHYDWRRISVMINRCAGGGTVAFDPPAMHEVANDPVTVAVGDFNGDNRPDIVSGNFASLSVLSGLGDGTFTTATNYFMGGRYAAVGDFNQDTVPDIAMDLGGKVGLFWNATVPRMQISLTAGGVKLAWPAWQDYQLQGAPGSGDSNTWENLVVDPTVVGSQFVITNGMAGQIRLFRLMKQ
jgi:hypothetical protein